MSLRFTTAGESHGPGLTAIVEGLPAGLPLRPEDIDRDLARRQLGHGRGGRMKIEKDRAEVTAGVRHGRTLGSPVCLRVDNRDFQNWEERMNPWPVETEVEEVHLPRPGHADLAGTMKFGHSDVRNVLERASARETAARVAAGALAKVFLGYLGVAVFSHVTRIGTAVAPERDELAPADFGDVDESPVRCLDAAASEAMVAEIDDARRANESLGGVFEVRAFGVVPGIGSLRLLGAAPGRPAGRRDHVHSGHEGRGHRRTASTWPSESARRRTTRSSSPRSAGSFARPTGRVVWRAG